MKRDSISGPARRRAKLRAAGRQRPAAVSSIEHAAKKPGARKNRAERRQAERAAKAQGASYRKNRALQIVWSNDAVIHVKGPIYKVHSQSSSAYYQVNANRRTCSCKDYQKRRRPCKHVFALEMILAGQRPGKPALPPTPNPYKNPRGYDKAKEREERAVRELLRCLGALVPESEENAEGPGRTPIRRGDILVAAGLAAYLNRPSRKAISDPKELRRFFGGPVPAAITLRLRMREEWFTDVVQQAIVKVGNCVRNMAHDFSLDATYLRTPLSEITAKLVKGSKRLTIAVKSCKLFVATDCKTLIPVAATVTNEFVNDQTQFVPLFNQFANRFLIDRVFADAGFNSAEHYELVAAYGGRAFIDFQAGSKPQKGFPHYNEMLALYLDEDSNEWDRNYNQRPKIETLNSVLKRTIKRALRARSERGRLNEALLAVLAMGLCRLHMARLQYNVAIPFADDRALAVVDGIDLDEEEAA